MNLTIEIEGQKELGQSFEYVRKGLVDFRQLGTWRAVAKEFYKILKAQFSSEGSAGKSGKWAPLKPKYAAIKRARYGDQPILSATGKMRRSLTDNAENSVYQETANDLTIGTKDPKAGYHQRGTSRMKQREILSFTADQEKQLVAPIYQKLRQLIANAKLRESRGF